MSLDYSNPNWQSIRETLGLSPSFVADQVGVSRQFIYMIEAYSKKPSQKNKEKLIEFYTEKLIDYHKSLLKKAKHVDMLLTALSISSEFKKEQNQCLTTDYR